MHPFFLLMGLATFSARLEGPGIENVVVLHDRQHLFVYRREKERLVPRFLGSGFRGLEMLSARPAQDGTLRVIARRRNDGARTVLSCAFREFPLVCEEIEE